MQGEFYGICANAAGVHCRAALESGAFAMALAAVDVDGLYLLHAG
jgi:hypothetical protein